MLGQVLGGLTDATTAEAVAADVTTAAVMQHIRAAAGAAGTSVGAFVASKVRHLIEHGAEDLWLDLLGAMSGSPQPGVKAIERIIAYAFPDPARVSIKRSST
jgi:hypothetical protein